MHMRSDDPYSWRPRTISFPRFAMLISGGEGRYRVIWPGQYLVRKSRTTGRLIYRFDRDQF